MPSTMALSLCGYLGVCTVSSHQTSAFRKIRDATLGSEHISEKLSIQRYSGALDGDGSGSTRLAFRSGLKQA